MRCRRIARPSTTGTRPRYLDCCASSYRPFAWFVIQTGARVSEAIAVRNADLDDLSNSSAVLGRRLHERSRHHELKLLAMTRLAGRKTHVWLRGFYAVGIIDSVILSA